MNTEDTGTKAFSQHYKQLELGNRATWDDVKISYRRLVNLWHPDRFEQRPEQRAQAQQKFIDLTKSYNVLRNFHRSNNRMPYQSAHLADKEVPKSSTGRAQKVADSNNSNDSEPVAVDESLLKRDPKYKRNNGNHKSNTRLILWGLTACALLSFTIVFFMIQDRKASQAIAEQGREIIKQVPPSEFMPSASEIRKSQTRGAFVKPTQ